jgi:pimeloyl-ACP methyl ester carboxylesterase
MTTNRIVRLLLVFYIPFGANTASSQAGKIIDPVICRSDPGQSYALYIPAKGNKDALPVIYFFDAHGAGALPLNKYKSLADEYGFILIGSNNSKNGNDWSTTENIWRLLSEDAQNRLKINSNRIYTCGFSGGAKVAGYVALQHPVVKGVIANGAALPDGVPAGDFPFSFTAIAGEGDMNLTELVTISNNLDNSRTRHRILLFDGKHEWAPERTMNMAFAGLQFDAMQTGLFPKDKIFIDGYIAKSKSRFESYYKTAQLIKAAQECRFSISLLEGLTDESAWFKEKLASLTRNTLYQKQRQTQEDLLEREQNTKAEYMQHFQQADSHYWAKTITGLQTKAGAKTAESGMYQRLLAYLSLAFYSLSNHLINGNANTEARRFVELYKMADPTNSEAWYLSAVLNARDQHTRAAEDDLLKAAEDGFNDESRLLQQPEFKSLSPRIDLSRIKSRMHAPS